MKAQMTHPVQTQSQLSHPMETCTSCGWLFRDSPFRTCRSCRVVHVIDINALDPLDPVHVRNDAQFDRRRDIDERGLVERDARNEENPHQFQGGREY